MNIAKQLFRECLFRTSTRRDEEGRRWVRNPTSESGFWVATRRLKRTLPTAKEYLKAKPDRYPWGKLWSEYGRTFVPPAYRVCRDMQKDNEFMQEAHCYSNALVVSLYMLKGGRKEKVSYVEGLAVDPTGAYPHAWVSIGDEVCEPTWTSGFLATYFGVPFNPEWVDETARRVGRIGMLAGWDKFSGFVTKELSARSRP